ncbi:hypothetical protein [Fangia hongkongensis]|uniref:hypothetical protein n=1 Tax=Fangia hongkongensis TaxID=270495 RepID=UPI00037A8140|nr:hypothetical protein [Fangia hongkongensis]MBK2125493.1 hypothetical protein [Fangia hongkongensis]
MISKFIRSIGMLSISALALVLSGCIAAGVYTAQTTVATIDGAQMNKVVITPKTKPVSAVNKVLINLDYLDENNKASLGKSIHQNIIQSLKEAGIYQPDNNNADTIRITISKVTDTYADKSVQSYVEVFNAKGKAEYSAVYIMNGKGLRRVSYVEGEFAKVLVKDLQQAPEAK